MSIRSNYFKMNKKDFESYLSDLKRSDNTIKILGDRYFFNQSPECMELILKLRDKLHDFDVLMNSFTSFSRKQIIQSFLIDEIVSTNKIENINSTKHDIFSVINNAASSSDKKIISIANAYKRMTLSKGEKITSCKKLRELYDEILKDGLDKNDLPDGLYFRKGNVYITDGLKTDHIGLSGEENINRAMDEFLKLYNSKNEVFLKMLLCHFIFENVHPFYDGNGRFGRFLLSNGLYLETNSLFSFAISSSFEKEKSKYYKAFKLADDQYEFGCLNSYFETMMEILIEQIGKMIDEFTDKKTKMPLNDSSIMTKSEKKVYELIKEATLFSDFGISNKEIIAESGVSKRTLMYVLKTMDGKSLLIDTKIGKLTYHKFASESKIKEKM